MKGIDPFVTYRSTCPDPEWRKSPVCNGCHHLITETAHTPRGNPYTDRRCAIGGMVKIRGG